MTTRSLLCLCIVAIAASSCSRYAYYQSPLQTLAHSYRDIPLQQENKPTAVYASAQITGGGANVFYKDATHSFGGTLHVSHNFKGFQAFYGVRGLTGKYGVDSVFAGSGLFANQNLDQDLINSNTGNRSFSAIGGFAGFNLVRPTRRGEWRIIGVEFSYDKEYGDYLEFRKLLADSSANIIERRNRFVTIGLNTEFIERWRHGTFGYRVGFVVRPGAIHGFDLDGEPMTLSSNYLAQSIHFSRKRITGYLQWNFGPRAATVIFGGSYQLYFKK